MQAYIFPQAECFDNCTFFIQMLHWGKAFLGGNCTYVGTYLGI